MARGSRTAAKTAAAQQKVVLDDVATATPQVDADTAASAAVRQLAGLPDAVGQILGLVLASPAHRHLFLSDLEWLVIPPVMLQQFRLFRKDGRVVGYASWAFLSAEAETRMLKGARRIAPADWRSGEALWLIELVAPFGGGEAMLVELREKVFAGKKLKTLQAAPGGKGVAMVEW
ncbi:MAG: toxin-activating lysine-acyltransferase [Alphaproteobacteria bacterium]|nr:toxin-activating lysine-acyltransferase [Alphaproteobacteria bacterium]